MEPKSSLWAAQIDCGKGGDHEAEPLSFVCLDPGCSSALCCSICLHESHSGHHTQPLKLLLRQARQRAQAAQEGVPDARTLSDSTADLRKSLLQLVSDLRETLLELLARAEAAVEENCAGLREKLVFPEVNLDQLNEQLQGLRTEADLRSLITSLRREDQRREELPAKPQQVARLLHQQLAATAQAGRKLAQEVRGLVATWVDSLPKLESLEKQNWPFRFSEVCRHADLRLVSPEVLEHSAGQNSFKLAVLEPSLGGLGCVSARFRLSDINVGVGVCLLGRAKDNGFCIKNYSFPGHGFYGMYGSKLVFSHSAEELNYKQLAFSLDPSVPLDLSVGTDTLCFSQPGRQDSFILPFEHHPT